MKCVGASLALSICLPVLGAEKRNAAVAVAHELFGSAEFNLAGIPAPAKGDLAEGAQWRVLTGEIDPNSGGIASLADGKTARHEDDPRANFFFAPETKSGRIVVDFGKPIRIEQINTYSWHGGPRGPQVFKVYGRAGEGAGAAGELDDLAAGGWSLLAAVDTRSKSEDGAGQHGASITALEGGVLGEFRELLFAVESPDARERFSNTFYSEIDVLEKKAQPQDGKIAGQEGIKVVETGKYRLTIDYSEAPDLQDWVEKELSPVVQEWYPKIAGMLPSDGYEPPTRVSITFLKDMGGVANASGNRIRASANWIRNNLKGESKGSIVHELVHVVQQYGRARRNNPEATRTPGWVVEGVPDYIRWFLYEPQSKGAEITARNIARARYDGNYRISANFLNYVVEKYDRELIRKLNAAAREGKYREELWKEWTGKTLSELGDEWKAAMQARIDGEAGERD